MDRHGAPGKVRERQDVDRARARRALRLSVSRGALRELEHSRSRAALRQRRRAGRDRRGGAGRTQLRRLCADRARGVDRARGEERHPDRRVRGRRAAQRPQHRGRGHRRGAAAVSAGDDDELRLHPGPAAVGDRHRRGRGKPARRGHASGRRHARGGLPRHFRHTDALRRVPVAARTGRPARRGAGDDPGRNRRLKRTDEACHNNHSRGVSPMAKSRIPERRIPERMSTVSQLDQVASDTTMPERPLDPKSRRPSKSQNLRARLPFECVALLLQGGGALGAYQAGVYEALAETGLHPDWVVGISIGAINAAIIAGNAPERRVDKLREFWEGITAPSIGFDADVVGLLERGDAARMLANQVSAAIVASAGTPGFFRPRIPNPWFHPPGKIEATSYYDTRALKATLERVVDFDRVNSIDKDTRLSLGAVNVRSGNMVYFDSATQVIGPEHVMASGALPPGFPAIEIEGEYYWDGGLISNTPLQWIVTNQQLPDALVFQVDLWSARGEFPRNLAEVATRQKEIQYSSRTRAFTDFIKRLHKLRNTVAALLEELPEEMKQSEQVKFLSSAVERHAANIVQLIYRPKGYEGDSKDYEFSRRSMEEHWRAGYYDAVHALRHPEIFERPTGRYETLVTFDLRRDSDD